MCMQRLRAQPALGCCVATSGWQAPPAVLHTSFAACRACLSASDRDHQGMFCISAALIVQFACTCTHSNRVLCLALVPPAAAAVVSPATTPDS